MKAKYVIGVVLFFGLLSGCKNPDEFRNVVYFTGTEETTEARYAVDAPKELSISVTCSEKVAEDVVVDVKPATELIEQYNNDNGTTFPALPTEAYSISGNKVTIKAGKNISESLDLNVSDLNVLSKGVWYCLPLTISGVEGNAYPVLESSRTIYVLITRSVETTALQSTSLYYTVPAFLDNDEVRAIPELTMECRAYASAYKTSNPFICSLIGIEENYLIRMGDVTIGMDQIQLAGGGYQLASNTKIALNQWYHFAVTYDGRKLYMYINGKLDASRDAPRGNINLTDPWSGGFHIGFSAGGRQWFGMISEARVWTRCLKPGELKNNLCYVDPQSEGLLGYWRLDQASGVDAEDLTGHGYTAVRSNTGTLNNIKCPAN